MMSLYQLTEAVGNEDNEVPPIEWTAHISPAVGSDSAIDSEAGDDFTFALLFFRRF